MLWPDEAWLVRVDSFSWSESLRLARGMCSIHRQSLTGRKGDAIYRKSGGASPTEKFPGRVSRAVAIEWLILMSAICGDYPRTPAGVRLPLIVQARGTQRTRPPG